MPSSGDTVLATAPTGVQERRFRRLLREAVLSTPMYARLYSGVHLDDKSLTLTQLLNRLPIISKSDLLETPLEERTSQRHDVTELFVESTTGSTGQPFSMYVDKSYKIRRNLRFLRALTSVGYRPWQRLMLLTDRYSVSTRIGVTRYYEPVEQSTTTILEAYERIKPQVLYGLLTPLRLLSERLAETSKKWHRPRVVISTAEMLDRRSKQDLEAVFGCPVFDFYGMTEMGLVAWQRPGTERYIMSPNSVLTELLPDKSGQDRYRMIMTNLDLRASPMIRFDSGDLASVQWAENRPNIQTIEGRSLDTIIGHDGLELSPYRITDAFRDVDGLRRFKITQRDLRDLLIELEVDEDQQVVAARSAEKIFAQLLGPGLTLDIKFHSQLITEGSRKFRTVESHVSRV